MADNLIFRIGFDLEKAVNEAGQQWDKKYAKRLEDYMAKRPVRIKLDFEKLEDVKKRLAQLKIEPITPETKTAIRELAKELQQLAKALEQVQKYSTAKAGASPNAVRASKIALNEERAKAQAALTAQRAAKAEDNLAAARLKAARAANVGMSATRAANKSYQEQTTYLQRLTQRMAAYWSIQQVGGFLTNVREVTAEFELQRVSLGAIIQDQNKANQLFSEIKSFALKSPVSILDLTKYTKQLAAYKIGADELFETTKKLTDVSVGLGVSMDRVVLAYGQTRATGYLRASEIRQFTEMGVPIVEELATKLSKMNGELVTAAQVMDMVSKRGISFELVKEVFDDMTSAGGMFYNMQEKQGNTLYGMWAKLGDAAAVMYDEIGRTEEVNSAMKSSINLLRQAFLHWKQVGVVIGIASAALLAYAARSKSATLAQRISTSAGKAKILAMQQEIAALDRQALAQNKLDRLSRIHIATQRAATAASLQAATATNIFSKALYGMKAAFLSNPWGWIILAISTVVGWLYTAENATEKLSNKLGEIDLQYDKKNMDDAQNFKDLADAAVDAADGSKKQKDALEELERTYGKIIPQELLKIENLREMNGEYSKLISLIEEYNAKQKKSEQDAAVHESFDPEIQRRREEAKEMIKQNLKARGPLGEIGFLGDEIKADDRQIQTLFNSINKYAETTTDKFEVLRKAAQDFYDVLNEQQKSLINMSAAEYGITPVDQMVNLLQSSTQTVKDAANNLFGWPLDYNYGFLVDMIQDIIDMNNALQANQDELDKEEAELNKYSEIVERAAKVVQNNTESGGILKVMTQFDIQDEEKVAELIKQLQEGKIQKITLDMLDSDAFDKITDAYKAAVASLEPLKVFDEDSYQASLDKLTKEYEETKRKIEASPITLTSLEEADYSKYDVESQVLMLNNDKINTLINETKEMLKLGGVEIQDEWFEVIKKLDPEDLTQTSLIHFKEIMNAVKDGINDPLLISELENLQRHYEMLAPSDPTMQAAYKKIFSIGKYTGVSVKTIMMLLKKSDENWVTYQERIGDEVANSKQHIQELKGEIADLQRASANLPSIFNAIYSAEIAAKKIRLSQEEKNLKAEEETKKWIDTHIYEQNEKAAKGSKARSRGSKKSDPRLQNLKEEISLLQKLYAEYKKLEKQEGAARAAEDMRKLAGKTIDMFKEKYEIDLPTNADNLASSLEILYKKMEALGTKAFPTLPKDLAELRWTIENVKIEDLQKNIEAELKRLADRISRTKTAKEFYEKILSQTGDVELAANVAIHVYGEQGKDLNKQIRSQIEKLLEPSGIKIDESVFRKDGTFDPKKLREFAESQKDAIGGIESKAYQELIKLSDNADKDFAKTIEGWLNAIEKAKSTSDKMLDLARTTRTEIDKITAQKGYAQTRIIELLGLGTRTDEQQQELKNLQSFLDVADKLIQGFKDKQTKEQTSLAYEMFKDSPMYVQMFDDLDHASTTMLENMRTRIEGLKGAWKDLTPTQLKELQSRMNEIDTQLAKRNPFKTLAKYISDYRTLRREGDSRGNKSEKAANADLMAASKAADEARKKYDELVKKYGKGSEETVKEVIDAKEELDRAMANEEAAQKAVENWKKVKDMIGLSANELSQMLNWAGDIAKGIADISEAMGADEEDVQYWNDVADALGQISGGIQDIVSAAMSGNVVGIISSALTAIPKMFVGFTNLFSAGKVRKANKEIKRQAELLEQLEYTYGQLEASADKLFGRDYLNNYNQQLKVLQAQQKAYLKQAEAERSKGKKADKEKIKEYENQARDTANAIKEMQDDLAAQIVGTDVASAARDFANAWLDAYLSFGSTTDAIKEKFDDMIKNMIVNMVLAQVVERALQPIFDMIDELAKDGELSAKDIAKVFAMVPQSMEGINNGLSVGMEALKAAGVDISKLREGSSEFSGIAKNIAGATSEEINTAAAIGNTIMYHTSHLPIISQNVAAMYQLMLQGKTSALPDTGATGWTDWQQQAMDNYNAIARNTADTVVRCERAAVACEAMAEKMGRIIVAKGGKFAVNTTYV